MALKPGVMWLGLIVILLSLLLGGAAWPVHAETPGHDDVVAVAPAGAAQLAATAAYTGYLPIVFGHTEPAQPEPSPEQQLIDLINAERARHGLAPLVAHPILMRVAEAHSQDMAARDFFSHTNPDDLDPCERMTRAGYNWYACGENIGGGFPTAAYVLMIWLNSDGHRANILSPYFTEIGVGYAEGGAYGKYWTVDFGARR